MAPNSLSPASVQIKYHSLYGAHVMTIPTLEWFPTSISGALGSYSPWTGSPIDAEVMIDDLIAKMKVFLNTDCSFDQVTVYTQATPTSSNIPRASKNIAVVGTSALTTYSAAISSTFNFKTLGNHDFRIVLLDSPLPSTGFVPVLPAGFDAATLALEATIQNTGHAWSGRDDTRPATLRKITYDLNDKLQKSYHLD